MSRWRSESLVLRVGPHTCMLDGAVLAARAGDWATLGAELATRVPPRARLTVSVADCWARYFLLAPAVGVASLRDCRLLLAARFDALYGESPANWVLQADWQAGAPMLACALPRALQDVLAPFRLARLQPALLALWNRHCPRLADTAALCAHADGHLNLLYWRGARMQLVRQARQHDTAATEAMLALELARLDAPLPDRRYWSGEAMPAGWTQLEGAA